MLDEMFAFEAYIYDFFIVEDFGAFLLLGGMTILGGGEGVLVTIGIDKTASVNANGVGFSFEI